MRNNPDQAERKTRELNEKLLWHARFGKHDKAMAAIRAGADPNCAQNGMNALMLAIEGGFVKFAKSLVPLTDLSASGPGGDTACHLCALASCQPVLADLLEHGADPFVANARGQTPFDLALRNHKARGTIETLLACELSRPPEQRHAQATRAALEYARSDEMIAEALRCPGDLAQFNKNPLSTLIERNKPHALRSALRMHPHWVRAADRTSSPLHAAARSRNPEFARILLEFGAPKDAFDYDGATPLHIAAFLGAEQTVAALADRESACRLSKPKDAAHAALPIAEALSHRRCSLSCLEILLPLSDPAILDGQGQRLGDLISACPDPEARSFCEKMALSIQLSPAQPGAKRPGL